MGLGLGIARLLVATSTVMNSSLTGTSSTSSVSTGDRPEIYLRAGVAAGYPLTSSLDLFAGAGAHISSGGRTLDYLSATIGVRLAL